MGKRERIEPKTHTEGELKVTVGGYLGDEEVTYEHPSYGMVAFSRLHCSGKQVLFGSPLDRHYASVRLRVHYGRRRHHLKRDWFSTADHNPVVEIEMSAAQFAEAITNMNVGDGVPCTIRYAEGRMVPDPPENAPLEVEKIRQSFAEDMREIGEKLKRSIGRADELLKKKSLTKQDRDDIMAELRLAAEHFQSNQKFAVDSFQESTDKIVTAAKTEIDATFQSVVREAGLQKLREGLEPPKLLLTAAPGPEDPSDPVEPETE